MPEGAFRRLGTTRLRQTGTIETVAVSADGRRVASAARDTTVCLWDTSTGRLLMQGQTMASPIGAVALSPDGRLLAAASHETSVRFWDTATGTELPPFVAHASGFYDARFSDDGRLLVLGCDDGSVVVVDAGTRRERKRLTGPGGAVRCVAPGPGGRRLACGTFEGRIAVWEFESGTLVRTLKPEGEEVRDIAWLPDGTKLALRLSNDVRVLEIDTERVMLSLEERQSGHALAVGPAGTVIAAASQDKILLWDAASGKDAGHLAGHLDTVASLAISSDGSTLVSGGYDHAIRIWDLPGRRERLPLLGKTGPLLSLVFAPDGRSLLSAGRDNVLRAWSIEAGQERWTWPLSWVPFSPRFLKDGTLLTGGHDGLHLLDLETRTERERPPTLPRSATVLSPDEKWAAWMLDGARVSVRTFREDELVAHLEHATSSEGLQDIVFLGGAPLLAGADRFGRLFFWNLPEGRIRHRIDNAMYEVSHVAVSPEGDLLALGSRMGELQVWEVASGQRVYRREPKPYLQRDAPVDFSPDGRWLVAQEGDDEIAFLDTFTFERAPGRRSNRAALETLAISPNSRLIAAGLADTSILLWAMPEPIGGKTTAPSLEGDWKLLQEGGAAEARAAMGRLVRRDDAVPFLGSRLREIPPGAAEIVEELLRGLDSEGAADRERARRDLAALGDEIEDRLRMPLPAGATVELREAVQDLLSGLQHPVTRSRRALAGLRAVQVLEWIRTPDAQAVLEEVSATAPSTRVRQRAVQGVLRIKAGLQRAPSRGE